MSTSITFIVHAFPFQWIGLTLSCWMIVISHIYLNKTCSWWSLTLTGMKGISAFTNNVEYSCVINVLLLSMLSINTPTKIIVLCACTQNSYNKNTLHKQIYRNWSELSTDKHTKKLFLQFVTWSKSCFTKLNQTLKLFKGPK